MLFCPQDYYLFFFFLYNIDVKILNSTEFICVIYIHFVFIHWFLWEHDSRICWYSMIMWQDTKDPVLFFELALGKTNIQTSEMKLLVNFNCQWFLIWYSFNIYSYIKSIGFEWENGCIWLCKFCFALDKNNKSLLLSLSTRCKF